MSLLGTRWYEKTRPGHEVEIIGTFTYEGLAHGVDEYLIRHNTAHNVRTQRTNSIIRKVNFHRRYRQILPGDPLKPEEKELLPVIHEVLVRNRDRTNLTISEEIAIAIVNHYKEKKNDDIC